MLLMWTFVLLLNCVLFVLGNQQATSESPTTSATDNCEANTHLGICRIPGADNMTQSDFMARLIKEIKYDKLLRPEIDHEVTVRTRIYVYFMQASEAHDMYFHAHFLLQLHYRDERLVYSGYSPKRMKIIGEDLISSSIWTPHIFLANEQKSTIMGTDKKDVLVSITPDGDVLFKRRIQALFYCRMDLQKFPFDEQVCSIQFESWMYDAKEVVLQWEKNTPATLDDALHMPEFRIVDTWVSQDIVYANDSNHRHGGFHGDYSALSFNFRLVRETGYYVLDYYIPSLMIVAISWVSFWLHPDASPPRITLGTSTMLSFITLASSQGKTLPKVSYIKASEIWFLGCTAFIFGSLVEFAFVNIIWRRKKVVELKKVNSKYIFKSTLTPGLARKQLSRSQEIRSSTNSLDGQTDGNKNSYNNYLTVQSISSQLNIPTITTSTSCEDITIAADNEDKQNDKQKSEHPTHGWTKMTPQEISFWIDRRARVAFPLGFLIFNFVYFGFVYLL